MGRYTQEPKVSQRRIEQWRVAELARHSFRRSSRKGTLGPERWERALRRLHERLHDLYGTPHLGNYSDPTDEFVYIVLARKTPEKAYRRAFVTLKLSGGWGSVATRTQPQVAAAIHGCGLEKKKALAILHGFELLRARLGAVDLRRASSYSDDELLAFLQSLPEVGMKSALCIMLYSFGRAVFPVDTHVGRVLARLGCLQEILPDLAMMDHKAKQRALIAVIPPDLRYGLHVNLLVHGRETCKARNPKCALCPLRRNCAFGRAAIRSAPHRSRHSLRTIPS